MKKLTSFSSKLVRYQVCGLDTMVFIYLFEKHPHYFALAQELIGLLEDKKISGITSVISPIEVLAAERLENYPELTAQYRNFFQKEKNLSTLEISWETVDLSAQLCRLYGLRIPDAIQLAVAQINGAKVFITNDNIFRKIKNFPILFLKDFV